MDSSIVKMNENTWRIEDGAVRFFLLAGTEKALLVDSGMTVTNAKDIAEKLTDLPVLLLNTHADRDHIGSNGQFERFYMHPDEAELYARSGKPGSVVPVREGDVIDLGNRKLEIVELPGHTPGSIAVLDRSSRVLISGDPIQRNGRIFMFGPHRNMEAYIRSLDKLDAEKDAFDEIWPSHADIPVTTDTIGMLRDGARDILAGRAGGTVEQFYGQAVKACDLGFCTILCDA